MSLKEFQLISKLGEGAYSSVYRVRRTQDNTDYALKKVQLEKLSDKEKENALNEVRILASIRHPNIVSYKEAFIDLNSNSLCIIMEYADNGDLFQKIVEHQKKGQYMKEQEVWNAITQMTQGLKTLHDMKIFHRDLKSANVFMYANGEVKLGDMNVSKVAKKGLLYTQTGTPYYASPEVWKDQPYDSKSDIWSLGCVVYEMLTLKPPFRADDMEGLYKKVTKGLYPKIPSQFSQELSNVIRSMLQVNPHMRPTPDKLLQLPFLGSRTLDLSAEAGDENILLQTIRFPKKIYQLTAMLPKPNYNPFKMRTNEKQKQLKSIVRLTEEDTTHLDQSKIISKLDLSEERTIDVQKKKRIIPSAYNQHQSPIPAHKLHSQSQNVSNLEDYEQNQSQNSLTNMENKYAPLASHKVDPRLKVKVKIASKSIDHNDNMDSKQYLLDQITETNHQRDIHKISNSNRARADENNRRGGATSVIDINPDNISISQKKKNKSLPKSSMTSAQNSKKSLDYQLPVIQPRPIRNERDEEHQMKMIQQRKEASRRVHLNAQQRNQSVPNNNLLPIIIQSKAAYGL